MKELTLQEHVTALFVIAMYEWLIGEEENAGYTLVVATQVASRSHLAVA